MATHGTIGKFDSRTEDWASYAERLTEYFTANDVKSAEKKRAILLSGVGPSTYQVIRNLVAPSKLTEKNFDQIVEVVRDHYQPTPSVIVQRFKFNTRSQRPGETISSFVAELRRLAEHCNSGRHASRPSCVWNFRWTSAMPPTGRAKFEILKSFRNISSH